jgi:hypothetical protein
MSRSFGVVLAILSVVTPVLADEPVPPTRAQLTQAVHRFVDPHGDLEWCGPPTLVGNEMRYECSRTDCPGGCQVVHIVTVLGFRAGRFRQVSQREEDVGDTGECGCCL